MSDDAARVVELEAMVEKLTDKAFELESEVETARGQAESHQATIQELKVALASAEAAAEEAAKPSGEVAAIQSQNDRLRQALMVLRDKSKREEAAANERVAAAEADAVAARKALDAAGNYERMVERVTEQNLELEEAKTDLSAKLAAAEAAQQAWDAERDALMQQHAKSVADLRAATDQKDVMLNKYRQAVQKLKSNAGVQQAQVATLQQQVATLTAQFAAGGSTGSGDASAASPPEPEPKPEPEAAKPAPATPPPAPAPVPAPTPVVQGVPEAEVAALREAHEAAVAALQSTVATLQADVSRMEAEVTAANEQRSSTAQKHLVLSKQVADAETRRKVLERRLDDARQTNNKQQQQLDAATEQVEALKSAGTSDKGSVDKLQAEIVQLKQALDKAHAAAKTARARVAAGSAATSATPTAQDPAAGRLQLRALSTALRNATQAASFWRTRAMGTQLSTLGALPTIRPARKTVTGVDGVRAAAHALEVQVLRARAALTPVSVADAGGAKSPFQQLESRKAYVCRLSASLAQLRAQAHEHTRPPAFATDSYP